MKTVNRLLRAFSLLTIAGYGAATGNAQVRTLTVNSTQFTNQPITVSPVDNASQGNGTTPFTRNYNNGTNVTLVAPFTSFVKWQKDGVQVSTNPTTTVAMDANHAMTAVYLANPPLGPFTNGSFENEFTGWYWYGNSQTVKVKTGLPATNGSTVIEFNSNESANDGALVQSFTTTPGKSYTVTFDQGVLSYTNASQVMRVHVAGTNNLLTQDFSLKGIGGGNVNYTSRSVSFTADSTTTTLSFFDKSTTTNSIDLLLDNVAVNETGAPVLGANALSNGSFEQDYNGWSPAGATRIEAPGPPYTTDGLKMLSFNVGEAPTDGAVSQSFATTPGATYSVQFDFGTLGYTNDQQTIRTLVTGSGTLLNQTASVTCRSDYVIVWGAFSYTFVANSQVTTLTLSDASATGNALDGFLDNVRVIGTTGGANTAPVAVADSYSTGTNTPLVIPAAGVLTNDTDAQANPLTAAINAGPGHGSVTLNSNGSFTYTPANGYAGADSFTYHANDGSLDSNIATVSISIGTVTGSNVLLNGSFESNFANWTTTGNQGIQSSAPYVPTNGSKLVAFNSGETSPNAVLSQSFTTIVGQPYTLAFDAGVLAYNTNSQTLQVTVNGAATLLTRVITINGPGGGNTLWQPQSFNFVADSSVTTLTFRDQSSFTNGLDLVLDNVRVTGQAGTIDTAPVAFADSYSTPLNTALVIPAAGVLANDTDSEGDSLTAALHALPTHGNLALSPNGGFTYTPTNGYSGPDSFTYHASDGVLDSNVATVSLTVGSPGSQLLLNGSFESGFSGWTTTGNQSIESSAPYAPTDGTKLAAFNSANLTANAVLSQSFSTVAGQTYTLAFDAGVLAYNNNSQQLQVTVDGSANLLTRVINSTGAGNGTNVWSPKTYTFVADSTVTKLTFRDQSTATNGLDLTLDNVRVNGTAGVPNTAPVAVADSYTASQSTALSISGTGVLANDTDAESNPLTAVVNTLPGHGALALNANGSFTYTPASGYTGPDSFTYHANDGVSNSNIATVSITVNATAAGAVFNGSFEQGETSWTMTGNRLVYQSDGSYIATHPLPTSTAHLLIFNAAQTAPNGVIKQTFTTTPGQSYVLEFDVGTLGANTDEQKLHINVVNANSEMSVEEIDFFVHHAGNTPDSLVYETAFVSGNGLGTSSWTHKAYPFVANSNLTTLALSDISASTSNIDLLLDNVSIATTGSNHAPVAVTDSYSVNQNTPLVVAANGVLANDTDAESNPLTAALVSNVAHGTLALNANGGFTYTPASGYAGPDSFTYKANDGALDSNVATVSITVNATSSQLLVNGSFESNFTGWNTTGNQVIQSASPYAATNGTRLVGFNGGNLTPNAVLSQSFPTVAGQTYTLTFDSGVLSYVSAQQKLQVSVDGTVNLLSQLITINGTNTGTSVWSSRTFSFTANSPTTVLTFTDKSTTTNSLDLLLDNVKIATSAAPSAFPSSLLASLSAPGTPAIDAPAAPDTYSPGTPVVKEVIPQPSVKIEVIDGKKYLVLTVAKPAVPDGVKRIVEVSPDLQTWFSGKKHTTTITDNEKVLKVRDNTPIRPGAKRYIRLKPNAFKDWKFSSTKGVKQASLGQRPG